MGPTLYIIIESDLQPKSTNNELFKYTNDTNLLTVPEHTDVAVVEEYAHIKQWALQNNMIVNEARTKETVFRRPST